MNGELDLHKQVSFVRTKITQLKLPDLHRSSLYGKHHRVSLEIPFESSAYYKLPYLAMYNS